MAHKIKSGKDFAASLPSDAVWHGIGYYNPDCTFAELRANCDVDFTVSKLPNLHGSIVSGNSFYLQRSGMDESDPKSILCPHVGKVYHIFQNQILLDLVAKAESYGFKPETIGSLDHGQKVFICCKLGKSICLRNNLNDCTNQFVVFLNGHDGKTLTQAFFTDVRVVCNNTLMQAMRGVKTRYAFKHTANNQIKVEELGKVLNIFEANEKIKVDFYNKAFETALSESEFKSFYLRMNLTEGEIAALVNDGIDAETVVSTRKKNIIQDMYDYALNGYGQAVQNGRNLYTAMNGVGGYYQHVSAVGQRSPESIVFGSIADQLAASVKLAENFVPLSQTQTNLIWDKYVLN